MSEKITIVIQMDGNYPDISSGIVSFENSKTGTKISIRPADLESGIYGIKSITMSSPTTKRLMGFWRRLYYSSYFYGKIFHRHGTNSGRLVRRRS